MILFSICLMDWEQEPASGNHLGQGGVECLMRMVK